MKHPKLLIKALALLACLLCELGAAAAEAYACYTPDDSTMTFYYDTQRGTRTGTTYDLNTGGNKPGWYNDGSYSSVTQVVFDPSFADARPTSGYGWFYQMSNLTSITGMKEYLNTSQMTNMYYMFFACSSLTSLDLSGFNTSEVTTMAYMFRECSSLTSLDLSSFNTAKLTNMEGMFELCFGLTSIDLSSFNTANVDDMGQMFNICQSLKSLDLSSFNTANVTDMHHMFSGCSGLISLDLSRFNTAKVTEMNGMFNSCSGLTSLDLSSFNTAKVTEMRSMFCYCTNLVTIYVGDEWSTAAVINSSQMFTRCTKLVGGEGTTYDANYTDKTYAHIDGGTANPGYFTAPPVYQAYACYTPDNTTLTFYYDTQRSNRTGTTYDLNTESTAPEWSIITIWQSATRVVFDPSFADARPTSCLKWFNNMFKVESITGMQYLNTSEVTNMGDMFSGCNALTCIDLSNFNTANVTNMWDMFLGCLGLTSIDLSSFNTANVENMGSMFIGCTGLTSLDLSSFNTANVLNMRDMFRYCTSLTTIYVGDGWSTAAVYSSSNMFLDCSSLVGGQGTTYNSSNPVDKTYAHIDGGPSNPGYFTEKVDFQRGDVNGDGHVNITDAIKLINYLANGNSDGINLNAADCNEDSSINITDAIVLINFLLNGTW